MWWCFSLARVQHLCHVHFQQPAADVRRHQRDIQRAVPDRQDAVAGGAGARLRTTGRREPPRALLRRRRIESELASSRPHVLVATRGGRKLLEFSANYCHKTNSIMFVLFVRQINVINDRRHRGMW